MDFNGHLTDEDVGERYLFISHRVILKVGPVILICRTTILIEQVIHLRYRYP